MDQLGTNVKKICKTMEAQCTARSTDSLTVLRVAFSEREFLIFGLLDRTGSGVFNAKPIFCAGEGFVVNFYTIISILIIEIFNFQL